MFAPSCLLAGGVFAACAGCVRSSIRSSRSGLRPARSSLSSSLVLASLLGAIAPGSAYADDPEPGADEAPAPTITQPVLVTPATLSYPDEARADGVHGDVAVRVTLDAAGAVTGVEFLAGPEMFQAEGVAAGWRLGFAPATRDGVPVPSTIQVSFHFEPPVESDDPFGSDDEPLVLVVEAERAADTDTHARVTLGEAELGRASGQDLAETLSQISGVTASRGTSDAAKPIIRGQPERRLLLLYDGIRHESQKWGPDHAPEIDPFAAGSISVVKGAAGARWGPDAIGGVILVDPPPMRAEPGVSGKALFSFASNGIRPYGALRVDGAPGRVPGLALRGEATYTRGAALDAPHYVLGNTGSEQWNAGASVSYTRARARVQASYRHYSLRAGVFFGVQNGTPDEFKAQLTAPRPVSADLWTRTYAIARPYQLVTHDVASLRSWVRLGHWGGLTATYAFQINHRQEFEQARSSVTGPQYDFTLRTHSLDLALDHDPVHVGRTAFEGGAALQSTFQENVYAGLPLLPNYRGFAFGVSAFERARWTAGAVEVGARYDHLARTAYLGRLDFERHLRRGTIAEGSCDYQDDVARCPASYDTGSVSLGGLWRAVPDTLDLKLDLSSASRFPQVDELYLLGSAPTLPVYAIGSPDLGVETTWGVSPTLGLRASWIELELSGYVNYIHDYAYFAPEQTEQGEPAFDVTIRGAFPRYGTHAISALFDGVDGSVSIGPEWPLGLDVGGSLVRAKDLSSGEQLVGIPPDRLRFALNGRPPSTATFDAPFLTATVDVVGRQGRVDPALDLAPAPAAYVLVGLAAGADLKLPRAVLHLGVDVTNLLNREYREYTSLLRYYADEPGRDVRVRLGVDF